MFDPYHKWLGIPPREQPPDHYRLLGLARFESDREVIDAASNRQMAYLQSCAGSAQADRVALSQRLLNEVAAARLCLLDPATRLAYDATLRPRRPADPPPLAAPASTQRIAEAEVDTESPTPRTRPSRVEPTSTPLPRQPRPGRPEGRQPVLTSESPSLAVDQARLRARLRSSNRRFWGQLALVGLILLGVLGPVLNGLRYPAPPEPPPPGVAGAAGSPRVAATEAPPSPSSSGPAEPSAANPIDPAPAPQPTPGAAALVDRSEPATSDRAPGPADSRPSAAVAEPPSPGEPPASRERPPEVAERPPWSPPPLPHFAERRYRPLFAGRTIDRPLVNMSNCTEAMYTNFALRFQFRMRSRGNQPWTGVRLKHGGPRLSLILSDGACGGLLRDRATPNLRAGLRETRLDNLHRIVQPSQNAEGRFGSWNDADVVFQGATVTVAINGVVVNYLTDAFEGKGLICLMGFEDGIAFRAVRVVDLGATVAPVAPPSASRGPEILQWRTNDWDGSPRDFADRIGDTARVGMGDQDYGFAAVGFEATGVARVRVEVNTSGPFRSVDFNTGSGFMIDYQTPSGYTRRQFLAFAPSVLPRTETSPTWGKATAPDAAASLPLDKRTEIDLRRWAPAGWDGRVWVTLLANNTGRNTWVWAKMTPLR